MKTRQGIIVTALAAGAALWCSAPIQAQTVIYDNGPLSTGATSSGGTAAPAGATWSEVQNDAGNTTQSNTVAGFAGNADSTAPAGGFMLTDDFTIPAGQAWTIHGVAFFNYKTMATPPATSPFDVTRLRITRGRPGDPGSTVVFGDMTTNRQISSTSTNTFRIFNTTVPVSAPANANDDRLIWRNVASALSNVTTGTPLTLTAGTYWVETQISDTVNGAHFMPSVTIVGDRGLPAWNGRQRVSAIDPQWQRQSDNGNPGISPDTVQDMPFQVIGFLDGCNAALPPCSADINGNGSVEVNDLLAVVGTWGQNGNPTGPRPQGDVAPSPNGNCIVDVNDLLAVVGTWGACPPVTGACCLPAGTCSTLTAAQCAAQAGRFQGSGVSCTAVTCVVFPANDNCNNPVTVVNGANSWNNANATDDGPIPNCGVLSPPAPAAQGTAGQIARDVWFTYTATCSGNLTIDTLGTAAPFTDTVIAVYNGTNCFNVPELACNDDISATNGLSSMTLSVTAGQVLKIQAGSFPGGGSGPATLNISCVAVSNDTCAGATTVAIGGSVSDTLDGVTAKNPVPPSCGTAGVGLGRWHRVVGNGATLTARTCNTPNAEAYDLALSIYTGASCASLTCVVGENDQACGTIPFHECVSWASTAGTTYWILVHHPVGQPPNPGEGNYLLEVAAGGPVCP